MMIPDISTSKKSYSKNRVSPYFFCDIHEYDFVTTKTLKNYGFIGETCFRPCQPYEAEIWAVYGVSDDDNFTLFDEFKTQQDAERFIKKIKNEYPHLKS